MCVVIDRMADGRDTFLGLYSRDLRVSGLGPRPNFLLGMYSLHGFASGLRRRTGRDRVS